jgi:hypothetical protein
MARYRLLAMTNAKSGREAEYNCWFDEVHIPDVLAVDGFVSAQRFRLAPAQRTPAPHPYQFAAIYELETHDLPTTLNALGHAVQNGGKTDSGDPTQRGLWVYEEIGPLRTKNSQ